jgi:hypothetical protein
VLVEGRDDREVFSEWYRDQLGDLYFYDAGGDLSLERLLEECLALSIHRRVYGIRDRDFRSDEEVQAALDDPSARLFILRRYAIENYLLEPAAVCEELRLFRGSGQSLPEPVEMATYLLEKCCQLRTAMAANWVFYDQGDGDRGRYFPPGHEKVGDRAFLVREAARRLSLSEEETEARIAEKEQLLDRALACLEDAHAYINGKHLLHQVYRDFFIRRGHQAPERAYLLRLLARTVRDRLGIHDDVRTLVELRVLGGP